MNDAALRNNLTFELKTDDFFPYASNKHSVWSGYYTSRPNSKRLERSANNILQVLSNNYNFADLITYSSFQTIKQLSSFELINEKDYSNNITLLKEAMGIMQHHDAITGTEKQHVAKDYARIVTKAIHTAESNIKTIVRSVERIFYRFFSQIYKNIQMYMFEIFTLIIKLRLERLLYHIV